MKHTTRNIIIATLAIVTLVSVTTTPASAMGMGWHGGDRQETLIQKLVARFGLKEADLKAFFGDLRSERQKDMQTQMETRLTQLVKDGKITEAQKKLIIDKHAQQQAAMEKDKETLKDKTPAERKAFMDAKRTELEVWAKANGIDMQYLAPFGRGGMGRGGHMR